MSNQIEQKVKVHIKCLDCLSTFQIESIKVNEDYFEDYSAFEFSENFFRAVCFICGSNNIDW